MIIYILVSNFTYFKRKGFEVAVGVSFMFLGQKLPKSPPRGPLGLVDLLAEMEYSIHNYVSISVHSPAIMNHVCQLKMSPSYLHRELVLIHGVCLVSTVAQNQRTITLLWRGPFVLPW